MNVLLEWSTLGRADTCIGGIIYVSFILIGMDYF